MPVLSEQNRSEAWGAIMRDSSFGQSIGAITKADLRAAVDALDNFLDANAAAINAAIPQPARAELTTKQKAHLLMLVISRRYSVET